MKPNYRRCVSCKKLALKDSFWRIVRVYPSRTVQLNQGMGRSAYLCHQVSCLTHAKAKKQLDKALRVSVPEHIYHSLSDLLNSTNTPV